ncbi:MAG TPA: GAF domain-containing protein, partial [Anaerolineae bacterium]|nr:GAF domain-containing protein [Anaerolineae bacterium]
MRLISVTRKRTAGALIATAVFLMAVRRCITLFRLLTGDLSRPPDLPAELVALAISVLMAVGIARIAPVFLSIRRSEDTLRESEKRLYLLVQNMPVMMDAFDADWNIIVWNRECERVTGYSADEIVGNPKAMELLYPDTAYRERMMAEWIARGDDYRDWEWEITCKDGSVKTVAWSNISKLFPISGWATWGIGMDVTERKRVEEALKLRMEQLAALSRASQAVTASLKLDQVLAEIVSLAGEVLASDYTSVVLVDEAGHIGRSAENLSGVPTIEYRVRDEGLTSWIVRSRQAVVIDEIGEDGTINPDLGAGAPRTANPLIVEAGVKSVAGLPLVAKDRLLGVLYLHSLRPAAFRGQLPLLTTFANQVAFAIENARLYEEAKGHAAKLATLYETGKDITSILELDALLQLIAERSARLTGADKSLILLVDTEAKVLTKAVGFGFTPGQIESITYQEVQDGISGWVLKERTPTISEDILTDPRSTGLALQMAKKEHEKGKSIAVAPLLIKGEVIGTLTVINNVGKPTFSQDDLDLVFMLASQAAIAIENARLYEAVQQELAERKRAEEALRRECDLARALEEAAAVVSGTLDPDQVLDRILEQVSRVVPNDASNIMLIEGDQARIVRCRGYERFGTEEFVSTVAFRVPEVRHLLQMIESKEPIIIPDTATYPSWVHVLAQGWLRSYAAAPIIVRDEVIGFLNVDSATPGFFTQAHVESLRAFASHAAAAIENARLYESERKRSAELKT